MIIDNLIFEGTKILRQENIENPMLDAELLLTPITKKEREFSIIYGREKIDNKSVLKYFDLINRRKKKEPIAYILNKKEFWSTNFVVDKNVLIPRPDTEIILFDSKGYEKSIGFDHQLLNNVPTSVNKMLAGNIRYDDKLDKYSKIADIIDISGSLETSGEKDISKIIET